MQHWKKRKQCLLQTALNHLSTEFKVIVVLMNCLGFTVEQEIRSDIQKTLPGIVNDKLDGLLDLLKIWQVKNFKDLEAIDEIDLTTVLELVPRRHKNNLKRNPGEKTWEAVILQMKQKHPNHFGNMNLDDISPQVNSSMLCYFMYHATVDEMLRRMRKLEANAKKKYRKTDYSYQFPTTEANESLEEKAATLRAIKTSLPPPIDFDRIRQYMNMLFEKIRMEIELERTLIKEILTKFQYILHYDSCIDHFKRMTGKEIEEAFSDFVTYRVQAAIKFLTRDSTKKDACHTIEDTLQKAQKKLSNSSRQPELVAAMQMIATQLGETFELCILTIPELKQDEFKRRRSDFLGDCDDVMSSSEFVIGKHMKVTVFGIQGIRRENKSKPRLIIIDDLMEEVDSTVVSLITRGSHHGNASVIYITQNMFQQGKEQKTISLNSHYTCLFKNPRDSQQITFLARQLCPANPNFIQQAYIDATSRPFGFLFLELKQETPDEYRYRANIFGEGDPPFPVVYQPKYK
ncbi:hypothetical protein B566_EDAN014527 [Ephemera danica]|nr:hypothetical protein B566_EDAN014527 [Ephemera danica]